MLTRYTGYLENQWQLEGARKGEHMRAEVGQREVREVGRRMETARRQMGLTQRELARRMQVEHSTVLQMERGEGNPRLKTLLRLARVLGMPLGELLRPTPPRRHATREGRSRTARLCHRRRQLYALWLAYLQGRLAA